MFMSIREICCFTIGSGIPSHPVVFLEEMINEELKEWKVDKDISNN